MALRIIGIDHGSKEKLVKECGAEVFLDITKYDDKEIVEQVKKATGGRFYLILHLWTLKSSKKNVSESPQRLPGPRVL